MTVRIVGGAAVTETEIEHAVGSEAHRAAVVIGVRLVDLEDDQFARRERSALDQQEPGEAADSIAARRVVHVEIRLTLQVRMQRHTEQSLFAAEQDRLGEVENAELRDLAIFLHEPRDVATQFRDQE